ncbi:MAG TPA: FtsX-like permease family protein [Bryobacteraceae bacterium]
MARAIARRKEMAVRAALGAGKRRLVRQALTESLLLAALGGAGGLVLAYAGLRYVRGFLPQNLHLASTVRIDPAALAFTIAAAVLAGIVTGLAPVLAVVRAPIDEALRQTGRSTESGGSQRLHSVLVVAEVALAMVLLAGAGLLVRNFARMTALEPGFQPAGVLTVRMSLPQRKYQTGDSRAAFYSQLLERASAIAGVERASLSAGVPITGTPMLTGTWFEGRPAPPQGGRPSIPLNSISAQYFQTFGIPLLRGRAFTRADRAGAAAIVNQAFAEQFFPGQDALGKHIQYGAGRNWIEIVGIVGNVREGGFRKASAPTIYEPSLAFWEMTLALRSSRPAAALAHEASEAVRAIDPNQPVYDIATMEDRIGEALAADRANTILMGVFAGLALVLAAVGVFGVLAYFVGRRAHEIGIRMALGARPGEVLRMVLGRGMALAGAGIAVGIVGALFTSRAMETLLFELKPGDPLTLAAAPALFACVAALACYLPARRAARVDPMVTLRHE